MFNTTRLLHLGARCCLFIGIAGSAAHAAPVIVNFESVPVIATQPSYFASTSPMTVTVPGVATFTGGTVLGNESALPAQSFATEPNVYATADGIGYEPLITISIDPSFTVNEISFPGFNGTGAQSYTANAYNGTTLVATQTASLASNSDSGFSVFDLQGSNITSVTFGQTVATGDWDFSIDTVDFNGNIAMSPVPLPASAPMFGAALLALAGFGYGVKRKKAATAA